MSSSTQSRSRPGIRTAPSGSSGGSFLDRMKGPSGRTSLENNYDEPPRHNDHRKAPSRSNPARYDEEEAEDKAPAAGHGSDIWSRVTTVASQLTVNVSQAVQKTIQVADGEETPPGEESRLTKAMKAYHLAKARSPADLPAWLFEENERGVSAKTWRSSEPDQYEDQSQSERRTASRNKSGLRDIYDSVPRANNANTNTNTPTSTANAGGSGSKATDRLRAIRDAKRTANQNISEDAGERGSLRSDRRGGGLPSRPARQK